MEAGTSGPRHESHSGYAGATVAGAVLATLFFPLISLIAALLLVGNQADPRKRSQLRTWAWVSGCWLVLGFVIVLVLAGVVSGSGAGSIGRSGACQGEPKMGAAGQQIPGTHTFVLPCEFGGTETIQLP